MSRTYPESLVRVVEVLQDKVKHMEERIHTLEDRSAKCRCCNTEDPAMGKPTLIEEKQATTIQHRELAHESKHDVSHRRTSNTTYHQTPPRVIPPQAQALRESISPARGAVSVANVYTDGHVHDRRVHVDRRDLPSRDIVPRSNSIDRRPNSNSANMTERRGRADASSASARNISPSKMVRFDESVANAHQNINSGRYGVSSLDGNSIVTADVSSLSQLAPRRNSPMNRSLQVPSSRPQPSDGASSSMAPPHNFSPPGQNSTMRQPSATQSTQITQPTVTTVQPTSTRPANTSAPIVAHQRQFIGADNRLSSDPKHWNARQGPSATEVAKPRSVQQRVFPTETVYQSRSFDNGDASPGKVAGPGHNRPVTDFRNPSQDADEYYGNPTSRRRCESEPRITADETILDMPTGSAGRVRQPNEPTQIDRLNNGKTLPSVQASFQPPATARPLPQAVAAEGANRTVFVGSNDLPRRKSGMRNQTVR